jgi:predicted metalloprotease with PDZ domain
MSLCSTVVTSLAAAALGAALCTAASAEAPRVSYELAMPAPANHTYDVTLRVSGLDRSQTTVAMPIWIPGYYGDDHYARNVSRFEARDAAGRALEWHQDGDSAWTIATTGAHAVAVTYKLYANRYGDVGTQLAAQRAEFNGPETFMFVENADGRPVPGPVSLHIAKPAGWTIASGLLAMQTAVDTFTAPTYDVMVDCPTIVSPRLATADFSVDGKAYHLVVDGPGTYRVDDLSAVARQIVSSEVRMMGHAAYSQYWILFQTVAGGGMEHLNSTISGIPAYEWERKHDPAALDEDVPMGDFAFVFAHEHFHSWNVKRIRPRVLGPFDYLHEVHTRRLDVAEGLTEYYTYVHLMRSGFDQPKVVYKQFAGTLDTEETSPGRRWFSLGDLSWNTWWSSDDRDVPGGDYYDGAAAMALMLDLKIRHDTGGRHSLDDVMRYMFRDWDAKKENEFVSSGGTYGDGELPRIIEAATGDAEAAKLFTTWWDTTTLPDWNVYLGYAGLKLVKTPPKPDKASLDVTTAQVGAPEGVGFTPRARKLGYGIPSIAPDQLMISRVETGGAGQRAGLQVYDVLQSIDGALIGGRSLPGVLAAHRPGDVVNVGVLREERILSVPVTLGRAHLPTYAIEPKKDASKSARSLRADFEAGRPFG